MARRWSPALALLACLTAPACIVGGNTASADDPDGDDPFDAAPADPSDVMPPAPTPPAPRPPGPMRRDAALPDVAPSDAAEPDASRSDAAPVEPDIDMLLPDAAPPDAAADPAPVGGPGCLPGDDLDRQCRSVCDWLGACFASDAFCPGVGPADAPALIDECRADCLANPPLAMLICPHDRCEQTVEFVSAVSGAYAAACEGADLCDGAPDPDTAPLGRRAAMGDGGPRTHLLVTGPPSTPEEAARCVDAGLVGANIGTGLVGLFDLLQFDLEAAMRPAGPGVAADLMLMMDFVGWQPGSTGSQAGPLDLAHYRGAWTGAAVEPHPDAVDAFGEPVNVWPRAQVRCSRLITEPIPHQLMLSEGLQARLPLDGITLIAARLSGRVVVEPDGVSITDGLLTGYLMRGSIIAAIREIQARCAEADPEPVCRQLGQLFAGAADLDRLADEVVIPLLRGPDVRVDADGVPRPCADDCNAVSVCLRYRASPASPGVPR